MYTYIYVYIYIIRFFAIMHKQRGALYKGPDRSIISMNVYIFQPWRRLRMIEGFDYTRMPKNKWKNIIDICTPSHIV